MSELTHYTLNGNGPLLAIGEYYQAEQEADK